MNAIVTVTIGDVYAKLATVTHPLMMAYAKRVGAEFEVISKRVYPKANCVWEKFQISGLLKKYERIAFFDTDIVVGRATVNLFDLVPQDKFGAVDELGMNLKTEVYMAWMMDANKLYRTSVPWPGWYLNCGVMVFGQSHANVFDPPQNMNNEHLGEQNLINLRLSRAPDDVFLLHQKFNWVRWWTEEKRNACVLHYIHYKPRPFDDIVAMAKAMG